MRFRFALITDAHFGPSAAFRGQLRKLSHEAGPLTRQFVAKMRDEFRPDLVVNLGDVIEDQSLEADERHYREFLDALGGLPCPVLHVAGNHDTVHLDEGRLAKLWGREAPLHYTHRAGPLCFVILRTVETRGVRVELPEQQLAWLAHELEHAPYPVVVLMHHAAGDMSLDGNRWFESAPHLCRLKNRRTVRNVLEQSRKVLAVFNGHAHWNHLDVIGAIPYITLQSLVENVDDDAPGRAAAAWGLVEVEARRMTVRVAGREPARYRFSFPAEITLGDRG
jgi:calcineurin-like phosphoesterase family protein